MAPKAHPAHLHHLPATHSDGRHCQPDTSQVSYQCPSGTSHFVLLKPSLCPQDAGLSEQAGSLGPHKPLTEEQCTGARYKPHLKESRGSADTPLEWVPRAVSH